jgi:hypothetical protein
MVQEIQDEFERNFHIDIDELISIACQYQK